MPGLNFKDTIARSPYIFSIGVAGDSGSGKTTFTNAIRHIFGENLVSTITLDDYHIYDREQRKQLRITPLSPEANNLEQLEKDLSTLKQAIPIRKPVYNHVNGSFAEPVSFTPTKILIFEGLHTFFTEKLRNCLDFKLFVDPDVDVKRQWKIKRDIEVRGYRHSEVLDELAEREVDYQEFIAPQRKYADAIIRASFSKYGRDLGLHKNIYQIALYQSKLDHAVSNIDFSIDLLSLLSLGERNFSLEFKIEAVDTRELGVLTFDGELKYDMIRKLEQNVERQTRIHPIDMFTHRSYVTATEIAQLILAWHMINRRIYINNPNLE